MDDFVSESSIVGVSVFHSSEPKKAKKAWILVFLLFFVWIGYYVFYIYKKVKIEPEFSYKFFEFSLQEIPFPAVTFCHPLFAKDQTVNLRDIFKNPIQNLTAEQQNLLAANVQACVPELGSKIHQFCPLADTNYTIEALKSKFDNFDEVLNSCGYNFYNIKGSKLFNYVLTHFGFCFSFNLEGFPTIFNTKVISDDFKSYLRDGKIARNYNTSHSDHSFFINEANQSIHWSLENGFLLNSSETHPVRAFYKKGLNFEVKLDNVSSNFCPKIGKRFPIYFHQPNEMLTPFHEPVFIRKSAIFLLKAKVHKVDESLRPYPPQKRNCFFEGEQKLQFFKTYTKALCDFECLANFTLNHCGCVKFSMPRENSTRICGLNETACYIQVAKNWNLTCGCLQSCTFIEYKVEKSFWRAYSVRSNKILINVEIYFEKIFDEKVVIFGDYDIFQGFADFGGMLGTVFGASFISLIEIFYFLMLKFIKSKFKIKKSDYDEEFRNFFSSSTIHGIQFIFDRSKHKLVQIIWICAIILAFSCCFYNSRESYWKFSVVPETESLERQVSLEEVPFPAITICSPLFARGNLTIDPYELHSKMYKNRESAIKALSFDQFYYLIANLYWRSPNLLKLYIYLHNHYVKNIPPMELLNHRSEVDLFPYLNQSHLEVDQLFFDCKFQKVSILCSKLFKKVMTIHRICYAFNMQSYREIFNEGLPKNFDSYGKFREPEEPQWSLDQGYISNKPGQHPAKASQSNSLEFSLKVSKSLYRSPTTLFITLPNEILTHVSYAYALNYILHNNVKLSVIKKQTDVRLRRFLPKNRGCYFQDEKKLQFFSSYTRSNCIFECFTNYTLTNCGCIIYLLPHNNSTKICHSASEAECYDIISKRFPPLNDSLNPCDCLPTCNNIEYKYDIEQKLHKWGYKNYLVTNLTIQFVGGSEITEKETRVSFGLQEFLTNVGGFLGLYLGCSVISVLEVFYFSLNFLHKKLTRKTNRIESTNEESGTNKTNNFSNRETLLVSQNLGMNLAEIFNIEELLESHSACFGPKVIHDHLNENNGSDYEIELTISQIFN